MFFNPFMLKRTPAIQFGIAYINHVNRDPSQVTEVSLDGEYIPKSLLYTKCSREKKGIINYFFFRQAPTPTLVLASALSQPKYLLYTKLFTKLCIIWCMYISIILGGSCLHARCPEGSTRIIDLLTIQGVASVPLSMLWVTMQVGRTWLPSPRAGDVNPLQSPKARAFSVNVLNVGHQDMQWRCGVGGPVWTQSQFLCLPPLSKGALTPPAVAVKGTKNSVDTWGRNWKSPGNPAWPSAQLIVLHQTHSAAFSPLLSPALW